MTQSVADALFRNGWEVGVIGYRRPDDVSAPSAGEVCVGHRPIETSGAGVRPAGWMLRALVSRAPYSAAKYRSRSYGRATDRALRRGTEVLIADHAQTHFAVSAADRTHTPLVFLAHNVEGELYGQLAAEAKGRSGRWAYAREARLMAEVETALVRRARQVWALTPADAARLRSLFPGADVRTLAVASHLDPVDAAPPTCDVALIGSWSWRANARGLEWFSTEVVPHLPRDIRVEVAGGGADWLRGRHPNVAVRGVVADAQGFVSRARVMAVPSVAGGGVQIKTLDAIASGVPVVATAEAVRGLTDLPSSVSVAGNGAVFAGELTRFAAEVEERPRLDAVAWSQARRERLDADVAAWVAELTGGVGEHPAPSSIDAAGTRAPTG